jgi:cytochrome c-type biogenesis protein CcmH
MIMFWLIAAIFVAIALAFVLPPLLKGTVEKTDEGSKDANIAIYRDQISELEEDLRNGIISPEQYQQDRDEIQRRLLEDVSATNNDSLTNGAEKNAAQAAAGRSTVYAITLGLPAVAIVLYLLVGNQGAISQSSPSSSGAATPSQTPSARNSQAEMTQQSMEANVAALARRLEQNPGDVQGWTMLGRSYTSLERYREASNAYAKATALKADDAELWADYAFALAMANGQRLEGPSLELVKKALKLDPENPKALELAGSAAFQAKDYNQAINYWQKLLQKTPPDSELARALSQRINEAKSLSGTRAR